MMQRPYKQPLCASPQFPAEPDASTFRQTRRKFISADQADSGCRKDVPLRTQNRNGLSLLEVIISVAIFLGALTAIMEGLSIGQRSEVAATLQSEAVLRCEAKMGEIICGAVEATGSEGNRFEDDETGDWVWSAQVTDSGVTGLLEVTVLVEHSAGGEIPNAAFSLVRLMRDPQLFLDAALQESE